MRAVLVSPIISSSIVAKTIVILGTAAIGLGSLAHANLIVNPSFESGNTGFTSDYTFLSQNTVPPSTEEGQYKIVQNLSQAHNAWAMFGSLSAQSGTNYFVANGAPNATLSPWSQTISISPGQITTSSSNAPVYYRFQAYIASVYGQGSAQPQLAFEMSLNNSGIWQELTSSTAPPSPYNWYLTYRDGYFNFMPTTVSFRLRNTVTAAGGNDFAVDSIYFGLSTNAPAYNPSTTPINSIGAITGGAVVPEPGTWAAAALLAGGAAFMRWRKRNA